MGAHIKDVNRLYKAVANYVEKNNGKVFVIGGIQVQEWPQDEAGVFVIAVRCTGRKPKFASAVSGGSDDTVASSIPTDPNS